MRGGKQVVVEPHRHEGVLFSHNLIWLAPVGLGKDFGCISDLLNPDRLDNPRHDLCQCLLHD